MGFMVLRSLGRSTRRATFAIAWNGAESVEEFSYNFSINANFSGVKRRKKNVTNTYGIVAPINQRPREVTR